MSQERERTEERQKQHSTTREQGSKIPSVFEILVASWNFLGWRFVGDKEYSSDGSTHHHEVNGKCVPRYYSPTFWLNFILVLIFRCRLMITKKGRHNFYEFVDHCIVEDTSRSTYFGIQAQFGKAHSGRVQRLNVFTSIYSRLGENLTDLRDGLDSRYNGDLWPYLFSKVMFVLWIVVNPWADRLPRLWVFVWQGLVLKLCLAREDIDLKEKLNRAGLMRFLERNSEEPTSFIVYMVLGLIIWSSILIGLYYFLTL